MDGSKSPIPSMLIMLAVVWEHGVRSWGSVDTAVGISPWSCRQVRMAIVNSCGVADSGLVRRRKRRLRTCWVRMLTMVGG